MKRNFAKTKEGKIVRLILVVLMLLSFIPLIAYTNINPAFGLQQTAEPGIPEGQDDLSATPLFAASEEPAWALSNMILSIMGILLASVAALHALLQKRRRQNEIKVQPAEEGAHGQVHGQTHSAAAWLGAAIALGIAGIILFVMVEDTSKVMVLFDKWSLLNGFFLAAGIIYFAVAFKSRKNSDTEAMPKEPVW
ncbi:MAG: hypothetical protein LBP91_02460 [Coriobacteriales bacterium]|jgi:hypothetical protein|nr:hypothetical protein [Coriobacteriales bacterium]